MHLQMNMLIMAVLINRVWQQIDSMSEKLTVVLNGEAVIEYDRSQRLPGHQRQFLDKMDDDMASGVEFNGVMVEQPDQVQRAQFVAIHLIQAILNSQDSVIAAMCAYLANRLPDLKQVRASQSGEEISFDLVFNEELKNQVKVNFEPGIKTQH